MSESIGGPDSIGPMGPIRDYELADWYSERIQIQLDQFAQQLDDDETYTTRVVLSDGRSVFPISIGYHNPNMLVIYGTDESGKEVVLLTPPASTQVVFTKYNKSELADPEPRQIGFQTRQSSDDSDPSTEQSSPVSFVDD